MCTWRTSKRAAAQPMQSYKHTETRFRRREHIRKRSRSYRTYNIYIPDGFHTAVHRCRSRTDARRSRNAAAAVVADDRQPMCLPACLVFAFLSLFVYIYICLCFCCCSFFRSLSLSLCFCVYMCLQHMISICVHSPLLHRRLKNRRVWGI